MNAQILARISRAAAELHIGDLAGDCISFRENLGEILVISSAILGAEDLGVS